MSLVKCKECGKEISKDAEICPNCGKKIKKGNLFLQIVGIIFILSIIGNIVDSDKTDSSSSSNQRKEEILQNIEYQKISPRELERKLEENAARAQQQYQGMYIEFQGKLGNIDADGEYFGVDSGDFLSSFHCSIKNEQQKQVLISKNKGDIVHVKGKITRVGEIMGYRVDVIELR
ncbi:MAG: zinc ribbon domain-containing protein [Alphaproteobacteria bacterium]|nr:zinc ribbon domain-containing protein [Alphaproteobacteria bacterium]